MYNIPVSTFGKETQNIFFVHIFYTSQFKSGVLCFIKQNIIYV